MSLLDDVLGSALGASAASSGPSLVQGILDFLGEPDAGGIDGLKQQFQRQGLGDQVQSWIGTGPNRPVTPDELERAIGRERVSSLGQRAGLPGGSAAGVLASVLPELVNQLTPEGQVPQRSAMLDVGKKILTGLAVGGAAVAGVAAVKAAAARAAGERPGPAAAPGAGARPRPDFSDVQAGASTAPAAAAAPAEEIYTVAAGDSLSKIAKRSYGNANEWRRIFEANRDQIENPDRIYPGQKLRIPKK